MAIAAADVIPLSQARANLSELADEVKAGAEKIITKNGESYVALIDAERLDYYHRLERERVHLVLLDDIEKGLADIEAGRTQEVREVLLELRRIEKSRAPSRAVSRRAKSKVAQR
jgi:prevent-host-death family protein